MTSDIIPLDSFFMDFITEAMKPIPKDAPSKQYLMKIQDKNVPYFVIDDRRGMFYDNIAYMMNGSPNTVKKMFNRLIKRLRTDKRTFYMMKDQHYKILRGDFKSLTVFKPKPFIYFEGITILIGFMRGKIRDEVYLEWNRRLHQEIERKQKLLYQPSSPREIPLFCDMPFSKNYTHCASKMEQIVCDLFLDLGIDLGRMDFIHKNRLKPKSRKLLEKHGFTGVDFDFFVKTKPYTIVDVQGVKGKLIYELKPQICKIEEWSLFIVKDDEDRNIPKLGERIKQIFITK